MCQQLDFYWNAIIRAHQEQFGSIGSQPGWLNWSLSPGLLVCKEDNQAQINNGEGSMFHHVFYSALITVFNLAFAILPAAPLYALKKRPRFAAENSHSGERRGSKNGMQQSSATSSA